MKVLVVDDDAGVRESLAGALEMYDFRVYQAATYQAAIDTIAEQNDLYDDPFIAAIVDWDLGLASDRTGPELVLALKIIDPRMGVCVVSGLERDPVPGADSQFVKGVGSTRDIIDFVKYEKEVREC